MEWVFCQCWEDQLFAHWAIPPEALRPLVPQALALDTFAGDAWLGITPFRVNSSRLRFLPPVPGLSSFPELNVRTYVSRKGKPGVFFFSLDAGNPLAAAGARALFHLPYHAARMCARREGDWFQFRSVRPSRDAPPAEFRAWYRPTRDPYQAAPGTLDHFLTERYRLYTLGRRGDLFQVEIRHTPWELQTAEAEMEKNTMAAAIGVKLPEDAPLLHFSSVKPAFIGPLQRVR